jgi:hypothetical protein
MGIRKLLLEKWKEMLMITVKLLEPLVAAKMQI